MNHSSVSMSILISHLYDRSRIYIAFIFHVHSFVTFTLLFNIYKYTLLFSIYILTRLQ